VKNIELVATSVVIIELREQSLQAPPTSTSLAMPSSFSTFKAAKDANELQIDTDDPVKTIKIGAGLNPKQESELVDFLWHKKDIFAWSLVEMLGVSWEVTEHTLNIKPDSKPVKHGMWHFNQEKRQAIGEELSRLLAAGFVKEIQHLDWIANPVLVPKNNEKWMICVDYTSLNKVCPKDPFPLLRIDQVIDLTSGCKLLSFLDANSGYHQIPLADADQPATTFITPFSCFCYVNMSFTLKNARATNRWCMHFYFKWQIGRNLEVYVDNIVVRSQKSGSLISDLEETFNNLRQFNIKLNPKSCTFRVPQGKLLAYIITEQGIEANTNKISVIAKMGQVRNVKDVQWILACLTVLNRFRYRVWECGLPLFKLLKEFASFRWMDKTQKTLDELKALITKLPILASPKPNETLLLYMLATTQVISMALVVEWEEPGHVYKVQWPVYYISKVLFDYETRYKEVQKLLYAILIMKHKLMYYLKSHPVRVVTSYGLGAIVRNRVTMGRIAKWALKLMGLDITYIP
jgi:hypothetical protein